MTLAILLTLAAAVVIYAFREVWREDKRHEDNATNEEPDEVIEKIDPSLNNLLRLKKEYQKCSRYIMSIENMDNLDYKCAILKGLHRRRQIIQDKVNSILN